jgi:hypothetical protein
MDIKLIMEKGKIAEYCIKLTAKLGFLGKSELSIRLVCTELK